MPYYITEENLEQFPTVDNRYVEMPTADGLVQQLAMGDLHGSALKTLYFLLKYNIVQMEEKNFYEFVRIFKALHELADRSPFFNFTEEEKQQIAADLQKIPEILNSITCNNPAVLELIETLLFGDDMGDRAGCDVINLIKFFILDKLDLEFRVLHSNHTAAFLLVAAENFPLKEKDLPFRTVLSITGSPNHQLFGQDRSLQTLGILLREKLLDSSQLAPLITTYLTHYRLFDFSLSADCKTFAFQTHADTEFSIIWHAANRLLKTKQQLSELTAEQKLSEEDEKSIIDSLNELDKITPLLQALEHLYDYHKKNPDNALQIENLGLALAYAMNKVNAAFYEFVANGLFSLLLDPFKEGSIDPVSNPIEFIAWNRSTTNLFRPTHFGGCEFYYLHGHTDSESPHDHVIGLDKNNSIGRTKVNTIKNNSTGRIKLTHTLNHEDQFPHYHLPDQLSRQRINQLLTDFNVDEFVQHLTTQINTDIEQEKTIENTPKAFSQNEENSPPFENDNNSLKKRASSAGDPSAKRVKLSIEAGEARFFAEQPRRQLVRSISEMPLQQRSETHSFFETADDKNSLKRSSSDKDSGAKRTKLAAEPSDVGIFSEQLRRRQLQRSKSDSLVPQTLATWMLKT